ncbi:hypothetical protein GPL20_11015 [Bradyrhizobium cajani]|uniref:Uncharacterized protein n=1 Tax=Bradyrhizobium cajani TaxID=1928661 RepID=A0A844TAU5_9BRAD|nr:hypothetical protein [Bradyrhizobium cajani]
MDFSCFGYHPDLESRLTIQEKWVLAYLSTPCFGGLPRRSARSGLSEPAPAPASAHRQRLKFGKLIIAQYQGRMLDRHQILHRCYSPISGTATRIYCESTIANL